MADTLRERQRQEAARYLNDLADRLEEYPMDHWKEAVEALRAEAGEELEARRRFPYMVDAGESAPTCPTCEGKGWVSPDDAKARAAEGGTMSDLTDAFEQMTPADQPDYDAEREPDGTHVAPCCPTCGGKGWVSPEDADRALVQAGELFNAGYSAGKSAATEAKP